jgi:GNAT superfamily N-acetyltransferase
MIAYHKLPDYRKTIVFEKEHPKELRWDEKYKLYMLQQNPKFQGIWFKEKGEPVAEILLSWQSDNVVHIDSFTVLPQYRGKGLGYELVFAAKEWAINEGFEVMTGEARKGTSWHIFENLGAKTIVLHKNWNDTGEEYMSFKMEL